MEIINHYSVDAIRSYKENFNADIVLYGAGNGASSYSKISLAALNSLNLKPDYFIDDDLSRAGTNLFDLEIRPPNFLAENLNKKIIFLSSNYFESIKNTLLKLGIVEHVYSSTDIIKNAPQSAFNDVMKYEEVLRRLHAHSTKLNRIQNMSLSSDKLILNAIDVQVTEKCTMKCKDCSNLMQYYEKPVNVDSRTLESNIEILLQAVDAIDDVRIIGGEPFLYNELPSLFKILTQSEKVYRITVYSNATFVPKPQILKALKNKKIEVEITDYDYLSKNHNEMIEAFNENKINYITHKPQNWTDSARIVKNDKSHSQLKEMFDRCCVNDVLSLLHGRIYHCPFSANAHNLNAIESDKLDWIDLDDCKNPKELRVHLMNFYFGRDYQAACKYCLGRDFSQPKVIPALQTKNVIPLNIVNIN